MWVLYLCPLLHLPSSTDIWDHAVLNIHGDENFFPYVAVAEQTEIGWDKLLLGKGTAFWQVFTEPC